MTRSLGAVISLVVAIPPLSCGAGPAARSAPRSIGGYSVTASESEPGTAEAWVTLPRGRGSALSTPLPALPSDPPRGADSTQMVISLGPEAHAIRGFGVAGSVEPPSPVRLPPPNPAAMGRSGGGASSSTPVLRGTLKDALAPLPGGAPEAARPVARPPAPAEPPAPAALVQYFELPPASSYRTTPLASAAPDAIVACRLDVLRLPAGTSVGTPPSVLCFGDGEPVFYPDFPRAGQPTRFVVWSAASARFVEGL